MAVTDLAPRLPGRLRPRPLPGGGSIWLWAAGGIAALVLAPVAALLWQAAQGSDGLWGHLWAYVLAPALGQTVILLAGVGIVVTVLGTTLAWLVAAHDFPGRRLLDWALLLPLAVPSYIIAFVYLEVTHPLGPLQDGLRALLGYASPREFRLLALLLEQAGRVVPRETLLREVWGSAQTETNTLAVHVRRLRRRLGETAGQPTVIESIRGVGYRFRAVPDLG